MPPQIKEKAEELQSTMLQKRLILIKRRQLQILLTRVITSERGRMQLSRNPFDGKNNRQYRIGNVRCLSSQGRKVYVYMYFYYIVSVKGAKHIIAHLKMDFEEQTRVRKKARKDDVPLEKERSEGQTTKQVWAKILDDTE